MTINARIKQVRIESGLTQEAFASAIGQKRGNYSQVELGNQLPSLEMITSIARKFSRSYEWLLEGLDYPITKTTRGNAKGNGKGNLLLTETALPYGKPQEVVVDTSGHTVVPIVDIRAAAGTGYFNPETIEEMDVLRLPPKLVKGKKALCIRVKGPSMAPTFQDGGHLVISLLEKTDWLNMRNEWCYVVVDTEGKTHFKRVKNRLSPDRGGFIVCTSDNPDKQSYPNFNLQHDELAFIWFVEMRNQFQQVMKRLK